MKTISPELTTHLTQEVTTLATCWKVTRTDAMVMGFTDHDTDLVFESIPYLASTGFNPTAIANFANLGVDNLDVEGMLSSSGIAEEDLLAGKYDAAQIEVFKVNYADLTQGALKLKKGWLGEVTLEQNHFVAEVTGLAQKLSQTVGELYSPSCRATLGDSRCSVNLAAHTFTGSVTSAADRQQFIDSTLTEPSGGFVHGNVTFTSGLNNGLGAEIKEYSYASGVGGSVIFALPMPYTISASDTFSITRGCDKTHATCRDVFSNVTNFRGEPHVPGLDKILETAGTRSEW